MRKHLLFILPYFLLASCSTVLYSCGGLCTKNQRDKSTTRIYQTLKDYFSFKPDTYWIYQNQDKTKTDSLYVTNFEEKILDIDVKGRCARDEYIFVTLNSKNSFLLDNKSLTWVLRFFYITSKEAIEDYNFAYTLQNVEMYKNINKYSFSDSKYLHIDFTKHTIVSNSSKWNQLKINDKEYKGEIYSFESEDEGFPLRNKFNIYHQKNIGIIGWSDTTDTFNLTSYKIIQ
jgi:hypothetical protein